MRVALLSLATLALIGAAPVRKPAPHGSAPRPAAVPRDWSRAAMRLPSGTFLLGNPRAKVKLAEYLSLTCPHCAHMEAVAIPPLVRDYVRKGSVSYEVRPAIRDPLDVAAMALARCAGPNRFFALLPALYAGQQEWVGKGYAWLQTAPPTDGKSNAEILKAVAAGAGIDAWFAGQGMAPATQAACFAGAEPTWLSKQAEAIWKPSFPGTPAFEINGVSAGTLGDWNDLKAKLVAAGA